MSILFRNAGILTRENDRLKFIDNGYLGVEGEKIKYVGTSRPDEVYTEEKDMRGKILMPGLVNDHTHTAMVLMRGLGSDKPLQEWLEEMWAIEDRMKKREIRVGMELALLEMIKSGTTCFRDMYLIPTAVVDTIGESGIRATISRCITCFNNEQDYDTFENALGSKALYDEYNGAFGGRLNIDFAVHAEYTANENIVRRYSEDAMKRGARMHIHLSETAKEQRECIEKYGKTPAEWFDALGLFSSPTTAAHCVHLTDDDMSLLKERNVSVVHNPTSNLKLGSGVARIPDMIDKGINVSLGTDGAASNNNLDMFEEMHIASIIHNGVRENPTIMKSETIIDMATINGARSQGRYDTGALLPGFRADIIALDLSSPHSVPLLNPLAQITYAMNSSDVSMTMVDGRILYENGEYLTLDRDRIYREVEECTEYLYGREK